MMSGIRIVSEIILLIEEAERIHHAFGDILPLEDPCISVRHDQAAIGYRIAPVLDDCCAAVHI